MVLLVLVAATGVVAGWLRRPAGGHGARPHLHHLWLLALGVALVVASLEVPDSASVLTRAAGVTLLAAFAGANRTVTGIAVAGLGVVLNLAALVLNNGIPVRQEALVEADAVEVDELAAYEADEPYHVQTGADGFAWLGAVVPVAATGQVLSFGDLLVLVGAFDVLRDAARRRARLPEVDEGSEPPEAQDEATTQAKVDQDWGTAPSGAPESGSQSSAKSDLAAAEAREFWRDAAVSPSPAHLAARQDK